MICALHAQTSMLSFILIMRRERGSSMDIQQWQSMLERRGYEVEVWPQCGKPFHAKTVHRVKDPDTDLHAFEQSSSGSSSEATSGTDHMNISSVNASWYQEMKSTWKRRR